MHRDTKVFDVLARCFHREDVSTCFALLGDANMNWATRLAEHGCRMIYVRHEHCAVAAAMAYARKSETVGVATVTCGPGVTQILTALPAAVRAHLPLVIFAGEAPLKSGWYNQGIDQAPLIEATGAAYHSLHHVDRMPIAIRDAFAQAKQENRPVVIGVPFDLQNQIWQGTADMPLTSHQVLAHASPMPPAPQDLARAVEMIAAARRVVIVAGLGVVNAQAGAACRALADKTGALLATSLPARGLFHDDPFCLGISGGFATETGQRYLAEADLVLAIGCSLAHHVNLGGKLWPGADILHIDVDPATVHHGRIAARHHLRADAKLAAEALNKALPPCDAPWRNAQIAADIANSPPDDFDFENDDGLLDPRQVVAALEACLPDAWQLVNSSGHCSHFFAHMPSRPQSNFLTIREFGAIGNGTSFAMGVAAALPEKTVVLLDGDGSLLMHIQELETMVRHDMNILIIVMNDGAYGSEIHKLRAEGLSEAGGSFGHSDFAAMARGFGAGGHKISDLKDLPRRLAAFRQTGGTEVWDFHVSDQIMSRLMRQSTGRTHS